MIPEAFLTCALALPGVHFTRPTITPYHASKNEEEQLKDWLRKNNPDADIFITPKGQADKLKEHGWERVPFNWDGKEVWIQRKPRKDITKTSA